MPGLVDPVADEREGLLDYLAQQRYVLCLAAYGLTDKQARATPTVSHLSVAGIIKHVAATERGWMNTVLGSGHGDDPAGFALLEGETLADIIGEYERVATDTEDIVAAIDDLGRPVPVPGDVPWFPDDIEAWSVRWVLLHLIEETARHAGHADIIREALDGATAFPLMAAAEGWPPTPWLRPWQPPGYRSNSVGSSR
ncbi:putative damage-inducible protein DinB [Saccharomonospora amisosensis]|uniref:Putative damage-inducible protein DinB n=1 Tax=Saccharomonospora amisosensis TaxID=1128677 RepID=A0A7X5UTC9_9PSEU|nr:DinB family protein [Saccharomonospora amisosensis]NIJ13879.1 putative damage-inducible protein DinB [Saccharomonospora amisosensis]